MSHRSALWLALMMALASPASAENVALEYQVIESPDLPADAPIVLAIHGYGDSATGFSRFVSRLKLPYRFIVPNAPTRRRQGGYSWYRVRTAQAGADVAASTRQLKTLVDHVRKRWPRAPRPLLIGFSQGAVMGFSMAARHPSALSGVVAISGYLVPGNLPIARSSAGPEMLLIHGRSDTVVPFEEGREAAERFRRKGYDVTFFEHPGAHGVPSKALNKARHWLGITVEAFRGGRWRQHKQGRPMR
ncbi:MAG: phospholipase/carboxylesterase [Myxococcota bacterium]|jgi:phospholipase/carboxylesterase